MSLQHEGAERDPDGGERSSVPLCSECGQPLKLVDLAVLGRSVGLVFPDDRSRYLLKCCGYEVMLEDDQEYAQAVEALKAIGSFAK